MIDLRRKLSAKQAGLVMDGPHPALLVRGDDELGALAEVHMKLYTAKVNVYASSGVADGRGEFRLPDLRQARGVRQSGGGARVVTEESKRGPVCQL